MFAWASVTTPTTKELRQPARIAVSKGSDAFARFAEDRIPQPRMTQEPRRQRGHEDILVRHGYEVTPRADDGQGPAGTVGPDE